MLPIFCAGPWGRGGGGAGEGRGEGRGEGGGSPTLSDKNPPKNQNRHKMFLVFVCDAQAIPMDSKKGELETDFFGWYLMFNVKFFLIFFLKFL